MTEKPLKIFERLHRLGYLWNVVQNQLPDLTESDDEVKTAILAIQKAFPDEYAALAALFHNYLPEQLGAIGPALLALIDAPRCCPLPDVPPPPGVEFAFDDEELQIAVKSQQLAAQIASDSRGSGSWPYGCWSDDGYDVHRVVIAVKQNSMPSHWRPHWEWVMQETRVHYSWSGVRLDYVPWDERADIKLQWRGNSGWIGLAEFPNGSCTDEVFQYLKPTYNPSDRRYRRNVHMHEVGHNLGLQHTSGANPSSDYQNWMMNPTINIFDPDVRNDRHWPTLRGFFGGAGSPAILEDQTDPNPPPVPSPPGNPLREPDGAVIIEDQLFKFWFQKA